MAPRMTAAKKNSNGPLHKPRRSLRLILTPIKLTRLTIQLATPAETASHFTQTDTRMNENITSKSTQTEEGLNENGGTGPEEASPSMPRVHKPFKQWDIRPLATQPGPPEIYGQPCPVSVHSQNDENLGVLFHYIAKFIAQTLEQPSLLSNLTTRERLTLCKTLSDCHPTISGSSLAEVTHKAYLPHEQRCVDYTLLKQSRSLLQNIVKIARVQSLNPDTPLRTFLKSKIIQNDLTDVTYQTLIHFLYIDLN